jgi:hypothetical protein
MYCCVWDDSYQTETLTKIYQLVPLRFVRVMCGVLCVSYKLVYNIDEDFRSKRPRHSPIVL